MKEPTLVAVTLIGVLLIATAPGQAAPINLSASAVFDQNTGGPPDSTPNNFTIANNADPGVLISQIQITLTGALLFDIAPGVPGSDPFHAFSPGGQPVGFVSSSVTGSDKVLTVTFNDFDPGEVFTFTIDVDSGDGMGNRNVPASQFEDDATIDFTFTGPFVGSPLTSSPPSAFVHPASGEPQPGTKARATFSGQAEMSNVIPEPASLLLWSVMGVGALVGGRRFLRRSSENAA